MLRYEHGQQTQCFDREHIRSTIVADLGWCLSVTIDELGDAGSHTASILFPNVVLPREGRGTAANVTITP